MWLSTPRRFTAVCALVLLSSTSVARAEAAGENSVINLTDAITKTLAHNPGLVAFGYQLEAQQALATQAGLRPNPELGVFVENALGTDDFQGMESAETTLSVAWVMERGKRQRRVDAARAGVALVEAEAEIRRLDAAAETTRRFLDSLALQERLVQTEHAVALADETAAVVRRPGSACPEARRSFDDRGRGDRRHRRAGRRGRAAICRRPSRVPIGRHRRV